MPAARSVARGGRAVAGAVSFLTIVPIGRWVDLDAEDVAGGSAVFPLVGAAIGALVGATGALAAGFLSPLVAAGLAVAVGIIVTGAIHLDGLADTADALGGRSRGRALEIMRDHTIGSFGSAALVLNLLVKAAALAVLIGAGYSISSALAAAAIARAAAPTLAVALPYVQTGSGTGSLARQVSQRAAIAAIVLAFGIAIAARGAKGVAMALGVGLLVLVLGVAYRRWLGGITGDTLGATMELSETLALVVSSAWSS